MLLSMTGYGRGERQFGEGRLQVEIRTVNHRFCEISVRIPRSIGGLEGKIRELIQGRISRGKINVNIGLDGVEASANNLHLNEDVSNAYMKAIESLRDRFELKGEFDVGTFLSLPDVLSWEPEQILEGEAWKQLEPALVQAIDDVGSMKAREGQNLAVDLRKRLDDIESGVDRVVARVPEMLEHHRTRLHERLQEIDQDQEFNRARLETEVVFFVDKTDCTEECVRLRSHLEQFRGLIDAPEPAGRKLNFLLQEMNRETNTIGSKAQDVPIARDVIQIKEEIEKLREQVQNFE